MTSSCLPSPLQTCSSLSYRLVIFVTNAKTNLEADIVLTNNIQTIPSSTERF